MESLIDVMDGWMEGKVYKLLNRMNENTVIKVITQVGTTGEASIAEIVGQGTIEGAIQSAICIGGRVEENFKDRPYEVWYTSV